MESFSPTILQLALHSLLVKKLQKSILSLWESCQHDWQQPRLAPEVTAISLPVQEVLPIQDIPIKLMQGIAQPGYVSGVAFKLSKEFGLPAIELARELKTKLATVINKSNEDDKHLPLDRVWAYFTIDVVPPGWIYFYLNHPGTALWAQLLVNHVNLEGDRFSQHNFKNHIDEHENNNQYLSNSTNLFGIQYTHARCCSLLRLAHREGLIQLTEASLKSLAIAPQIYAPNPLPWLDPEPFPYFNHPTEQHLIAQIIKTFDDWANPRLTLPVGHKAHWKLAFDISYAFQEFYAMCQIWGETQATAPDLAQVRLGLVSMVQKSLQIALQAKLGVNAPLWL